jgi:hypothetical protein
MFEYFYNEIFRKTIIGFGTLFNEITVKHTDGSDNDVSVIKVPLAYGPTQKFLARLEQVSDLNKPVQMSLPRMSFEFVGLNYDSGRKSSTTQTFITRLESDKKEVRKSYLPVPYNMEFELSIMTKLNDDMLQIIEQILPYFQPSYTLTIDLIENIGEKRDIPIVLEGISMSDNYEGDYTTRRSLVYTLRFIAKTYLFGPISDPSKDIIKKVSIGYIAGNQSETPSRELTYSVEARATKNYDGNVVTTLAKDIDPTTKTIEVIDASSINEKTYITIDSEEMYVKSKSGNNLVVERGRDNTLSENHVSGTPVGSITSVDNNLIEVGDDFGFSESF